MGATGIDGFRRETDMFHGSASWLIAMTAGTGRDCHAHKWDISKEQLGGGGELLPSCPSFGPLGNMGRWPFFGLLQKDSSRLLMLEKGAALSGGPPVFLQEVASSPPSPDLLVSLRWQ